MSTKNLISFGDRLRWAREKLDITQQEVAKRVGGGMAQSTIAGYETGARGTKNTAPKELFKIASVLGVNAEWLLTGDGKPYHDNRLNDAILLLEKMNDSQIDIAIRMLAAIPDTQKKVG